MKKLLVLLLTLLLTVAMVIPVAFPVAAADPTQTLLGRWMFNGNAIDYAHYPTAATVIGATWSTDVPSSPLYGNSLSFDGNDYVDCGNNSVWNLSDTDFTIEFWVKPAAIHQGLILKKYPGAPGGKEWAVYDNMNNLLFYDGGTWRDTGIDLTVGSWQHIAIVGDKTSLKLTPYKNSVPYAQVSFNAIVGGSDPLYIGMETTYTIFYFNGLIDEVRIWGNALTASQLDDITPPTISTNVTNGGYYPKGYQLTFGATDTGTGVKEVTATLDPYGDPSPFNINSPYTLNTAGKYILTINSKDHAVNASSPVTRTFIVLENFLTGGGTIKTVDGKVAWTIAGTVGIDEAGGIVGSFQIVDHLGGTPSYTGKLPVSYHCNSFSSLDFRSGAFDSGSPPASNSVAVFSGVFTNNRGLPPVTLTIVIADYGEPGAGTDKLTIFEPPLSSTAQFWIGWYVSEGPYHADGPYINTGNFQIHNIE